MSGILMMSVGNSYGSLPINTVAPVVSGTAETGQALSTTNGTWTGSPAPTFTYQWQRGTTNIGGATSASYALQEADVGNTVRCVVTATNSSGAVSANSNNSNVVVLGIGTSYGGGYFAGQISTTANSVATHNIVIGPRSTAQASRQWKTSNTSTAGTSSTIDGPTNSSNMNNASHPAAQFCEGLTIGGFSDWYMPAKNEFEVCYFNLKPRTNSNQTSSGINPNAVPARASNYTSGNPAQTSASIFQDTSSEALNGLYWTSSEVSGSYAWLQNYLDGHQIDFYFTKTSQNPVRAIRRVPV